MIPSGMTMSDEEKRQYGVAAEFVRLHPEYNPDQHNANLMLDWMELRDMKMSLEGLEMAFKAVFCGEPEPKVMSPELLFNMVQTNQLNQLNYVDSLWLLDKGVPAGGAVQWKPLDTGLKSTVSANTSFDMYDVVFDEIDPLYQLGPENKPEKSIAPAPSTCYSGDVVELMTKRRIKDND